MRGVTDASLPPITRVLARMAVGESGAAEQLLPLVYDELKSLARARMARLPAGQTLQATALVHEAWLKLGGDQPKPFQDRAHFFGAAARAMRNILVDQARAKATRKRGGGQDRAEVTPDLAVVEDVPTTDLLALDEALTALEREHGRPAQVIMLRYFAGLDMEDIAVTLGVTSRTVERDWRFARAWLRRVLDVE
jgi:RNA polymerase sigma factor (TIGR02999 family)